MVPQQELLEQKLKEAVVVSEENGTEIATISDIDMINAMQSSGFHVNINLIRVIIKKAGVTKLVWYGNKKLGKFNLYPLC